MILLEALAVYVVTGAVVAAAFAICGISRVMPHVPVTAGARLLLLPGAVALWPVILARWLASPRRP
jgi:hypothetical protein